MRRRLRRRRDPSTGASRRAWAFLARRRTPLAPKFTQILLNTAFSVFPDADVAAGKQDREQKPPPAEPVAFAQLTHGSGDAAL